jgi:hypothetical protein
MIIFKGREEYQKYHGEAVFNMDEIEIKFINQNITREGIIEIEKRTEIK